MPVIIPPVTSVTTRLFTWVDAAGTEHDLSAGQYISVMWASDGLFMTPYRFIEDALPFGVGSRLRTVRVESREIVLPIRMITPSDGDLHALKRSLYAWFDPTRGDGTLKMTAPDGSVRQITARYIGGLEMGESPTTYGPGWQTAVLRFRAFDPYWVDEADTEVSYSSGVGVATFFPFFPLVLLPSQVFGTTNIGNTGDVEAWPVWTFTGPGTDPSASNLTTGETFTCSITLGAGETLEVDTRPAHKSVVDSSGNNQFRLLTVGSSLWSLPVGTSSVSLGMGSTTGASGITLAYRRGWLGA